MLREAHNMHVVVSHESNELSVKQNSCRQEVVLQTCVPEGSTSQAQKSFCCKKLTTFAQLQADCSGRWEFLILELTPSSLLLDFDNSLHCLCRVDFGTFQALAQNLNFGVFPASTISLYSAMAPFILPSLNFTYFFSCCLFCAPFLPASLFLAHLCHCSLLNQDELVLG